MQLHLLAIYDAHCGNTSYNTAKDLLHIYNRKICKELLKKSSVYGVSEPQAPYRDSVSASAVDSLTQPLMYCHVHCHFDLTSTACSDAKYIGR